MITISMIDFIFPEVGYYQNKIPYNDLYIVSEYGYIDLKNFIFIKYESGMPRILYKVVFYLYIYIFIYYLFIY